MDDIIKLHNKIISSFKLGLPFKQYELQIKNILKDNSNLINNC